MSDVSQLSTAIRGEVSIDAQDLVRVSHDASIFHVTPTAVAYPVDTQDIKKLVTYANHNPGTSLTVRAAGTDMTGGPLNESIIVDVSRHLTRIKHIGDHTAVVEPGMPYRDFAAQVSAKGYLLPSYPASKELCTVGGMVANNSGGEKSLVYGKTEKFVQSVRAVLADGEEYEFEPLTLPELQQKMSLKTYEGNVYRTLVDLIDKHEDIIRIAKPAVSKNSTGYALWNIFDEHTQTFNVSQLLTGSQGTLGIITEITFRLITPKPYSCMLVMFVYDPSIISSLIRTTLRYHPESLESYDNHTLSLALRYFPQLAQQMGTKNSVSLFVKLLPEFMTILTSGMPPLMVLAEFTGYDKQEILRRATACKLALQQFNLKTRLVSDEEEMNKYWAIRRESFNLLRHKIHDKHTAPFIDDIIVAPQHLPKFLPRLTAIMAGYHITYTIAGHMGDGNFHIIPLLDLSKPEERAIIPELSQKVYDLVLEFHGSISAEHNDGLIRSPHLKKMYGPEVYALFEQTKHIFDPKNIFNPGKKVGSTWEYSMQHIVNE